MDHFLVIKFGQHVKTTKEFNSRFFFAPKIKIFDNEVTWSEVS